MPSRQHYLSLDGVRAVAVLLVLLAHGTSRFEPGGLHMSLGWIGVDLFFVLSGFLISNLLFRESDRFGSISLTRFYVRRSLRIWPLYYAVLLLYAFVLPHIDEELFGRVYVSAGSEGYPTYRDALWPHFVFLQNYLVEANEVRMGLSLFWSLAIEEHFYLVWPLLVVVVPRRYLGWGLMLITLGGVAVNALTAFQMLPTVGRGQTATHLRLYALGAGCWAAYLHNYRPERLAWLRRRRAWYWLAWLAIAFVGWQASADLAGRIRIPQVLVALRFLPAAATAVLIVILVGPEAPRAPLLSSRPMVYIGKISYGIYVLHPLVLGFVAVRLSGQTDAWWHLPLAFVSFGAGAIALAGLSYRFFEEPILRVKERFSRV
jgi:peptidoglycan/LPS O-acetylase OafA/YrhL